MNTYVFSRGVRDLDLLREVGTPLFLERGEPFLSVRSQQYTGRGRNLFLQSVLDVPASAVSDNDFIVAIPSRLRVANVLAYSNALLASSSADTRCAIKPQSCAVVASIHRALNMRSRAR